MGGGGGGWHGNREAPFDTAGRPGVTPLAAHPSPRSASGVIVAAISSGAGAGGRGGGVQRAHCNTRRASFHRSFGRFACGPAPPLVVSRLLGPRPRTRATRTARRRAVWRASPPLLGRNARVRPLPLACARLAAATAPPPTHTPTSSDSLAMPHSGSESTAVMASPRRACWPCASVRTSPPACAGRGRATPSFRHSGGRARSHHDLTGSARPLVPPPTQLPAGQALLRGGAAVQALRQPRLRDGLRGGSRPAHQAVHRGAREGCGRRR